MVLQRGMAARLWGWGTAGEQVAVELAGHRATGVVDSAGRWRIELTPLDAGGPYEMTIACGNESRVVRDVMVGEVWVCSGQSNMAMTVAAAGNAKEEIEAATAFPGTMLRMFTIPQRIASKPVDDVEGEWRACGSDTVGSFSATAHYFGRQLQRELNVPVGLIVASTGHTPAEAWMSRQSLEQDPQLRPHVEQLDAMFDAHPGSRDDVMQFIDDWRKKQKVHTRLFNDWYPRALEARGQGLPLPPALALPQGPANAQNPTLLHNGMIAPLIGVAMRGVIWYQGETNAIFRTAWQYRKLLPALIRDWRRQWNIGTFPFLFVQIANHCDVQCEPAADLWAEVRESQLLTLREPNTAMVVAIDLGESLAIHPANKQDVGKRLALAALAKAYGREVVYSGPIYRRMAVQGDVVRLWFDHVDGGLLARDGEPMAGFIMAGNDRNWHDAGATIDGDTVVVRSPLVLEPAAVRYAWTDDPRATLYNAAGLPASPFRTDDWPCVSEGVLRTQWNPSIA